MSQPSYRAPWWLPGCHLQTIYPQFFGRGPLPAYRRERWRCPDGDFVDLDWIDGALQQPLVVLFHGLEGSSRSAYARALMRTLAQRGLRGVVMHFRGCGGEANHQPRAYHSGDAEELDWMLRRLKTLSPAPLFAAGVSLGGNALLKWLAREGTRAKQVVTACAAVSAPLDLMAAGRQLEIGFNRLYARYFLATMKPKSLEKLRQFPGLFREQAVRQATTLRAFDNEVTAPLHGFRDVDDYWTRASSKNELSRIQVPTLLIHAMNDPFLPGCFLPDPSQVGAHVVCDFSASGGHAGFVSGPFPGNQRWLPRRILDFFQSQ